MKTKQLVLLLFLAEMAQLEEQAKTVSLFERVALDDDEDLSNDLHIDDGTKVEDYEEDAEEDGAGDAKTKKKLVFKLMFVHCLHAIDFMYSKTCQFFSRDGSLLLGLTSGVFDVGNVQVRYTCSHICVFSQKYTPNNNIT